MPETLSQAQASLEERIHISEQENKTVICFDTGLDPRSFARAKILQSLAETGFVVHGDGSCEIWKHSEVNEVNGLMRFWGPLFPATRLDTYLSSRTEQQTALEAVAFWIRAKLFLGDKHSTLNPAAVFINSNGSVFFAPENLSNRCLRLEGKEQNRYNCHNLSGMDSIAFSAGVMLYTILAKAHPYPTTDIYQDMSEGVFLPVHIAVPTLDKKLSSLIQAALLLPVKKPESSEGIPSLSGAEILDNLLSILMGKESLFQTLTDEESKLLNEQLNKEKERYLLKKKTVIKTIRYVTHNKLFLVAIAAISLFVIFLTISIIRNRLEQPTTEGLSSFDVVAAYYTAFNSMDHIFMDAIIMGADRSDVSAAINLFVIDRMRRAYEQPIIVSAETWIQQGGELPAENVFGLIDLIISHIGGSEEAGEIYFRAEYSVIQPHEPEPFNRNDILVLRQDRRNNWRITEILRASN
jgi:succinate dehydrogenase hydrophobic anchor subunit